VAQLTWDIDTGDLDIHFTRRDATGSLCVDFLSFGSVAGPQASLCDGTAPLDCNYARCRFQPPPEWDAIDGASAGDPTQDIDDVSGFGPEIVSVGELAAGEYLLAAHYYTPTDLTFATASLFLLGNEIYAGAAPMSATVRWLEFAIVIKDPAGGVCVEDLIDGSAVDDCPTPEQQGD
jgi:hypothetical protein